ncbi:MAG: histidine kinase [Bacteroidota bacterium]
MTTLLFPSLCLIAQDAPAGYIQHWDDKDGLSNNVVYCSLTDQSGQLWVGTINGLCRFDGQNFDFFQTNPKDSVALHGNEVRELYEAPDGKIWVGTDGGGLSIFDPKTERFQNLQQNLKGPFSGLTENRVYEIYPHPMLPELIIGYRAIGSGQGGITRMDYDGQILGHELTEERDYAGFPLKVTEYWIDPEDRSTHWIGGRSFYRYHVLEKRLEEFTHPTFVRNFNSIVGITGNPDGTLFVAHAYSGLQQFNPKEGKWGNMLDSAHCYDLIRDNQDRIWIANEKGIGIVDSLTGNIDYKIPKTGPENPFPGETFINSIHVHNELVWICAENGLFCWSPQFKQFPTKTLVYQSQIAYFPQWVGQDEQGHRWISSKNLGLLEVNQQWQVTQTFPFPMDRLPFRVAQLSNGDLILGTKPGFFFFSLDPTEAASNSKASTKRWTHDWENWTFSGFHPDSIRIWSIWQDRSDFVWLGTRYSGLIRLDLETKSFQQFLHDPKEILSLSHNKYLFHIQEGPDGNLWVCSDKGLSVINPKTLKFIDYPTIRERLGNYVIHCLETDERGNLWIGTRDQGLFRYRYDKDELVHYTIADGLPYNGVNELARQQNWLWMGTRQGLARMNLLTESIEQFDRKKGLASNALYGCRFVKLPSGKVMVTYESSSFFTLLEADKELVANAPPDVQIRSLRLLDQDEQATFYLNDQDSIRLKANQNYFAIDFSGLQYLSDRAPTFQYQLAGYDKDWVESGTNKAAIYTRLSGGKYQFNVKAIGQQGEESPVRSIAIFLATPWYFQTGWIIVFILIAIGIGWLIYHWRMKQIRREANLNRLIAETEMKALRAQINPHFIFNCLNSIKSYIIENEIDAGTTYVSRFSRLIRMILNASKDKLVPLVREIELIELYLWLEKERLDHRFESRIELNINTPQTELFIPPMLLQPFLENAIWHGIMNMDDKGLIHMIVDESDHYLNIRITDNGIGREQSKRIQQGSSMKRGSMGIEISKDRLEQISALYQLDTKIDIYDLHPDQEHAGTVVDIQFPKIKNRQHVESDYD